MPLKKKENTEKFEQQLKALELENEKKKEENRLLKTQEIALLQKEKELKEKQEDFEINLQKQMLEKQSEIEERARIKEREANDLKMKEVLKQLEPHLTHRRELFGKLLQLLGIADPLHRLGHRIDIDVIGFGDIRQAHERPRLFWRTIDLDLDFHGSSFRIRAGSPGDGMNCQFGPGRHEPQGG